MCILFSFISKRLKKNEFKLIILNNRDEYHHRPSKQASFVEKNNVYGIDLTEGKEGGTWLGASKTGKIGVLLNLDKVEYSNSIDDPNKEGRGFMVPNFLNGNMSAMNYCEILKTKANTYNPFNLLLYEKNEKDLFEACLFDNFDCVSKKIDSEYISISNHVYNKPYPKTIKGENFFKNIINEYNKVDKKVELIGKLFELAKYDAGKKFEEVAHSEKAVKEMMNEQIFINIPAYGTRTHTVILVDEENKLTFHEKTIEYPIDKKYPKWVETILEFYI